jgi:hypothetical protein
MPQPTTPPRLSVPTPLKPGALGSRDIVGIQRPPPAGWRGPAQLSQPKPAIVRKPCGFCNRVRVFIGMAPRR